MINKESKILITGGSGLVGLNLTERLVNEGYTNIRVNIHKRNVRKMFAGVDYVYLDLETRGAYVELLGQWGMLVMSFYFGGRTMEKIADRVKK